MILKKNIPALLLVIFFTALAFSGCKKYKGDVTVPAYIHLDRMDVVPQAQNAPSPEAGFYNSDIDAVQFVAYFDGDQSETNLGTFQLPCTVPVLRHETMKYLRIYPVVKQNGQSTSRIYYFYYNIVELNNVKLAADSVTHLGKFDNERQQWYLQTHYKTRSQINVLCEDYFEPTSFTSHFDSTVVWVSNDPDGACNGQGYGLVHIPDSVTTVDFFINDEFDIPNSTVYLELNYQADVELYVNMLGFEMGNNGALTSKGVMAMRPTTGRGWRKIYINLTRTWSQFNYNAPFTIYFQALNADGIAADVKIDNVKIISY